MFSFFRYSRESSSDDDEKDTEETQVAKDPSEPESEATKKLKAILDNEAPDDVEMEDSSATGGINASEQMKEEPVPEGMCVECEDQPSSGYCEQCKDSFCEVCFQAQHKKGRRRLHMLMKHEAASATSAAPTATSTAVVASTASNGDLEAKTKKSKAEESFVAPSIEFGVNFNTEVNAQWFVERSKYIPLRLSFEERKYLRLLEAALNVSDYTNKVDIYTYGSKAKRMAAQLKEMCAILSGLVVANDYSKGQILLKDREFKDNSQFFQKVFEIGRRYKIMNPEKMRGEYGKLVYMLQDSMSLHVQELLQFKCVRKIKTVYELLQAKGGLKVLEDQYLPVATREIIAEGKSRQQVQRDIKEKERAIEHIAKKYSTADLTDDEIKNCLYSIGDNHSYLRGNRDPIDKMITFLKKFFDADRFEEGFSLAIAGGRGGARLTHTHNRQYHYVLQSMTFWREVAHDMFKLWYLAEEDLLDESSSYRLCDTGQGLNRVQGAPRIGKAIHKILHNVQSQCENWVGSSVVHLGDHNVPNALMFIDKYTQVARILNPIVLCIEKIDELIENEELRAYLDSLGGPDFVRKAILCDFFRHGFDGSGADNFFDAGSCIDGRLTSAWNWCSKIEKKAYFPVFLLTGFVGFDGEF
eukprot:TRINITY_DN7425_c0_g3_i1.p1 TRINITY_DN7425_c0_g3~~TRINITY_DN7425_c0_g3_i1.p1  ORF type:complete len:640 (-),score=180.49 TRINITY_DN7425_c0_g3_i1:176-2095(-)